MKYFLISARPKQWIKNFLIFLPPLLSFQFSTSIFVFTLKAFISFCLISSSVYIFNDLLDIDKDKLHPLKKNRPIASGKIKFKKALSISFFFAALSLLLASTISIKIFLIIICYFFIQIFYCIKLKEIPILDILSVSSGFLLRALAGGAINNFVSPWFILTISLGALFLAIEKRKAEISILKNGKITRNVLTQYSLPFLNKIANLASTATFISYSLWAAGPELNGAKSSWMLLSVPFVIYGIFRYQLISDLYLSDKSKSLTTEEPENIILSDKYTLLNLIIWVTVLVSILAIF